MATVESSGVAKAGMVTGITSLGILGANLLNNGGLLGGLFGNGNAAAAMAGQGAYQAAISAKDAEIGQLKAERYADHVGASTFDRAIQLSNRNDEKINANLKEAYQELVVTRERLATADANFKCLADSVSGLKVNVAELNREVADMRVREQQTADAVDCLAKSTSMRFDSVYKAIDCAKRECGDAIALEAERRHAADQSIRCYVDATFVPGRLVMPREAICPEVMQRYNNWVAPTDQAPATQPISGTINANVTSRSK